MRLLVDTGVWLAAADADEPRHAACAEVLRRYADELLVAAPVVAETAWLLEARLGTKAEACFLRLAATGRLQVADLTPADYGRCVELVEQYADLGLGLVDASVVVVAENLALGTIATLNERDFRVVRPAHVDAFDLVP